MEGYRSKWSRRVKFVITADMTEWKTQVRTITAKKKGERKLISFIRASSKVYFVHNHMCSKT